MNASPVITGLGLITPLGQSVCQTWQSLLSGASIRNHSRLDPALAASAPRVTVLAKHAAREAVAQAGWKTPATKAHHQTAIIVGTSKGPVEDWITPPPPASACDKPVKPAMPSPAFGLASIADALASEFEMRDAPRLTLSAACASGLHALIRAAMMIQAGEASRVLVVAAEASVHPLFLGSFRRLGVLPPEGVPCRPFDRDRKGFLMSDAAAAVCLEARESDLGGAIRPVAAIERFAMAGDAKHLTAGDPTGRVLQQLFRRVIGDHPVDLIHAHGTGTPTNDPIELAAIDAALPAGNPVPVYSHKGALGHSLGASGLVSIVINCLAHTNAIVPPNINTPNPLMTKRTIVSNAAVERRVRRSVVFAAGFGGPTSVVSLLSI